MLDCLTSCVAAENPVTAFAPNGCPASVYSSFIRSVAQASAAGRFHRRPVGPIGSLLTLTDDKWAVAVEVAIGRALSTFVVHDFADQRTLSVSTTGGCGCVVNCMCSCAYLHVKPYHVTHNVLHH